MNGTIKVIGGKELRGEVVPIPNKNSIVSSLPAALLTDEKVAYKDVPETSDVEKILKILSLLGAEVEEKGRDIEITCKNVNSYIVDPELAGEFRGSLMFAGPLLARFGKAQIPVPGGCLLGFRSISAHVDVFKKVGIKVEEKGESVLFTKGIGGPAKVWQYEASVTATENLAMYAAGVEDEIEIVDAAAEPHVSDVLRLLSDMGAVIEGKGTNHLKIKGKKILKGATFVAGPDFVDIAGYMAGVGMAGGEIRIKGGNIWEVVMGMVNWFRAFGIEVLEDGDDLVVSRKGSLEYQLDTLGIPLAAADLPKLSPRPWPGFPVDVIPVMAALACKTKGKLLLQNWMYESGFDFVRELNALGADIFMADPQRIIIHGPVRFRGGEVTPPPVIQATKAIFLASLADNVETTINRVDILKRRYPNIFETYRKLGAEITRVES